MIAGAFRLGAVGITEFKRDEANLSQLALNLTHGREFPLLGINSSVGIPNPPISVYLFAIPYSVDDTPVLATLFVGLLNVAAVGLVWWISRRYYGRWAALVAGFIYAVSPWAVIYSRKIWAQDLLPVFVVAVVLTGLLGFGENRRWARWLHWPLLGLTLQIHYASVTLIPLSLLMILVWFRRAYWRDLLISAVIAALLFVPLFVGVSQSDLFSKDTVPSNNSRAIDSTALRYAWMLTAGTDIHSLAGSSQFRHFLDSAPDAYPLFYVIPMGVVLVCAYFIWRMVQTRQIRIRPDWVFLIWVLLPVVMFTWKWTPVAPHYMIPMMPAAFILLGAGVESISRLPRAISVGVVLALVVLQGWLMVSLLSFLNQHETPGGFGTPLHYLMDVRKAVLDENPDEVLVISTEEVAPEEHEPAVWGVLLDSVPTVRFVDGTQTVVVPADTSLELIAQDSDLLVCQEPCGRVFDLRPGSDHPYVLSQSPIIPDIEITPVDIVRYSNGVRLIGYSVEEKGVWLIWHLESAASLDYQVSLQVFDANGQKVAQQDRISWPGRYWKAGDTLYLWFDLVVPPDASHMFSTIYTLEDGEINDVIEVLDEQGAYLAQGADIVLD
jgi:hypothetical protein